MYVGKSKRGTKHQIVGKVEKKSIDCFEMTDVHDKKTRSFNMSRIRSKDTGQEIL
jgi:hypothetical protein